MSEHIYRYYKSIPSLEISGGFNPRYDINHINERIIGSGNESFNYDESNDIIDEMDDLLMNILPSTDKVVTVGAFDDSSGKSASTVEPGLWRMFGYRPANTMGKQSVNSKKSRKISKKPAKKQAKKPTKKQVKKPSRKLKKKVNKGRRLGSGNEGDILPVQRFSDMPCVDDISDGAPGSCPNYESSSSGTSTGIFGSSGDIYNSGESTDDSGFIDDSGSTDYISGNSTDSHLDGEPSDDDQSNDEDSNDEIENILYKTDDSIDDSTDNVTDNVTNNKIGEGAGYSTDDKNTSSDGDNILLGLLEPIDEVIGACESGEWSITDSLV